MVSLDLLVQLDVLVDPASLDLEDNLVDLDLLDHVVLRASLDRADLWERPEVLEDLDSKEPLVFLVDLDSLDVLDPLVDLA